MRVHPVYMGNTKIISNTNPTATPAKLRAGDRVVVNGTMYGRVAYVDVGGHWIGVSIEGEGRRVDEWQPFQVKLAAA